MRSRLAAVLLLGCLAAAAGCSSSSSSTAAPATTAASPAPASTVRNFQVSTPNGQVSLSLDGQLPPNWPSAFPVPSGATVAGSGSLGGPGSAALAAAYTTSQSPPDALAFYTGNSRLTTSGEKSVSAGEQYLGSVKVTAPYTGSVTVASHSGTTYIVIALKKLCGPARLPGRGAAMAYDMPGPMSGASSGGHLDAAVQGADAVGASPPPGTAEAPPPVAAAEGPQPSPEPGKPRKLLYVMLPGCWGALIAGCLSFTPSLLPRSGVTQGLIWGITAAIGYGLGVLFASIWRAFADRAPRRPRRLSWTVLFISAAVLVLVSFGLGQYWQYEIRQLMGVTDYSIGLAVASPVIAALVFCLILLIGRGLRGAYRWTAKLLSRWTGPRAARATGWLLVAGLVYLVVTGLLLQGFVNAMNSAYSVRDTTTAAGVQQPATGLRSGGPGSIISWGSLGRQGRNFTGSGPSASDIGKLTGHPAMEPIRIYAGLASAPDAESRAALALRDLQRAGAFGRKDLLVVTTTGSGWVDPALADSFEYLTGGDCATVAIQYSYLPSWVSYLVDQSKARDAGRALFDAVYGAWLQLPQGHRPRLFVAGESLGSFGGEAAFSGEYSLANLTAGVLFTGPPNFNTLFREFTDNRDPGSPEIQPVYRDGRIVRFADDPARAIPPSGQPWKGSRVLYLMHPSDPIIWWTPHLIFSEPSWISDHPRTDVLSNMFWMPFVTFWQVTADLPFATGVPAGHGHRYTSEYVNGWDSVLRPAGFTSQKLADLRKIIAVGD